MNGRLPVNSLVKRDAKGVKIATRIDRTIHSSRLLRGHVGERSRDKFGRVRSLALARHTRGNTETGQPGVVHSSIHKYVRWLDVFVDETTLMQLAECYSESNPTAKELFQFDGPSKKLIEWLSVRIIEQQHGPALLLCEGDRSNGPCWIELVFKREFVL